MNDFSDQGPGSFGEHALWTEGDLATHWKKSIRTLQRWRSEEYGPAFIRIGGSVRYRVEDVLAFEERQRQADGESA